MVPLWSRLRRLLPAHRPPAGVPGQIRFDYAPRRDGRPDPGEIVWAWVPYDENDGARQGPPGADRLARRRGRSSELRLDRIVRLAPDTVRREGAAPDRRLFLRVAHEAQRIQAELGSRR